MEFDSIAAANLWDRASCLARRDMDFVGHLVRGGCDRALAKRIEQETRGTILTPRGYRRAVMVAKSVGLTEKGQMIVGDCERSGGRVIGNR